MKNLIEWCIGLTLLGLFIATVALVRDGGTSLSDFVFANSVIIIAGVAGFAQIVKPAHT